MTAWIDVRPSSLKFPNSDGRPGRRRMILQPLDSAATTGHNNKELVHRRVWDARGYKKKKKNHWPPLSSSSSQPHRGGRRGVSPIAAKSLQLMSWSWHPQDQDQNVDENAMQVTPFLEGGALPQPPPPPRVVWIVGDDEDDFIPAFWNPHAERAVWETRRRERALLTSSSSSSLLVSETQCPVLAGGDRVDTLLLRQQEQQQPGAVEPKTAVTITSTSTAAASLRGRRRRAKNDALTEEGFANLFENLCL